MSQAAKFCADILPSVSRTFAINIPLLPAPMNDVVTAAYLLCRIADTVEDESTCESSLKNDLFGAFAACCALPEGWENLADRFARDAGAILRPQTPPDERRLVQHTRTVLQSVAEAPPWVRPHVSRCVAIMTRGMSDFAQTTQGRGVQGLADVPALRSYCYFVAGVVGEMLTGLFIGATEHAKNNAGILEPRAQAFGRALQLTNILKDIREDFDRGTVWLPLDRLAAHGLTVTNFTDTSNRSSAVALLNELLDEAGAETDAAFEYSLALPAEPKGYRLFCLYPLFFAVLTLSKLRDNPAVFDPSPVKISRLAIADVMLKTQVAVADDDALKTLYRELSCS